MHFACAGWCEGSSIKWMPRCPSCSLCVQHPALEEVQAQVLLVRVSGRHFCHQNARTRRRTRCSRTHSGGSQESASTRVGKTKIWYRAGEKPAVCDVLERMARIADPTTCVWRGSHGTPGHEGVGHTTWPPGFCQDSFGRRHSRSPTLDGQDSVLRDLQSSWLLLVLCAADYMSRVVEPDADQECRRHDAAVWRCFCTFTKTTRRERHSLDAFGVGRPLAEERDSHEQACVLGQWGRLSLNGPATSSASGCSTGHRVRRQSNIPLPPSRIPVQSRVDGKDNCDGTLLHMASDLLREPENHEPGTLQRGW